MGRGTKYSHITKKLLRYYKGGKVLELGAGGAVYKDLFENYIGKIKIIIVIRSQASLVESLYRHYVSDGGTLHIRDFIYHTSSPAVNDFGNNYMLTRFKYDILIEYARKLFGIENVIVLAFETITYKGGETFKGYFLKGLGVTLEDNSLVSDGKENSSFSYWGLHLLRVLNTLTSSNKSINSLFRHSDRVRPQVMRVTKWLDGKIMSSFGKKKKFIYKSKKWPFVEIIKRIKGTYRKDIDSITIDEDIRTSYANSNERLMSMLDFDLREYGYDMMHEEEVTYDDSTKTF